MTALVPLNGLFAPQTLLRGWGPWALLGIAAMVFVESGLLFPFLPGDSLLFVAGLLHKELHVSLPVMVLVAFLAAAGGDTIGYWLGQRFGRRLFSPDARILKTAHLLRAEKFFERYGGRSIILARFVPIVRTFIPLAVGSTQYRYPRFLAFNLIGAAAWTGLMIIGGSLLGGIDFVTKNIDLITIAIVAASVVPVVMQVLKSRRKPAVES